MHCIVIHMPTYVYFCSCCQKEIEIEHSIKDDPKTECPICKVVSLKRLISKSSFVLHGSGWAKDNYSKGSS